MSCEVRVARFLYVSLISTSSFSCTVQHTCGRMLPVSSIFPNNCNHRGCNVCSYFQLQILIVGNLLTFFLAYLLTCLSSFPRSKQRFGEINTAKTRPFYSTPDCHRDTFMTTLCLSIKRFSETTSHISKLSIEHIHETAAPRSS